MCHNHARVCALLQWAQKFFKKVKRFTSIVWIFFFLLFLRLLPFWRKKMTIIVRMKFFSNSSILCASSFSWNQLHTLSKVTICLWSDTISDCDMSCCTISRELLFMKKSVWDSRSWNTVLYAQKLTLR